MLLHAPLRTVTPTVDGDVLAILAGAEDWFTVAQLDLLIPARSREGIRRTLTRLADQGVVDVLTAGTTRSYRLNREHLAAPSIIALTFLRSTLFDRLRTELKGWEQLPEYAAVFGSAAEGRMSESSDIDLFLLHPGTDPSAWDGPLEDLAARARRWTGNVLNPLVLSRDEVIDSAPSEPVLQDIADRATPLIGEPRAFRKLAGARR